MSKEYQPVVIDNDFRFDMAPLRGRRIVVVPSQGVDGNTAIIKNVPGEMWYEHRQEAEICSSAGGVFVSRHLPPQAENEYRSNLFGNKRPLWLVPGGVKEGISLDQLVLADSGFLPHLTELIMGNGGFSNNVLYGFHATGKMVEIAQKLGIKYYGNPEFANIAGTKIGLQDFSAKYGIMTPTTMAIHDQGELLAIALELKSKGYENMVVKVDNSTGGMGHKKSKISDVISGCTVGKYDDFLPDEFQSDEGGVIQGWIDKPEARLVLNMFVDFDGGCSVSHVALKYQGGEEGFTYVPMDKKYLPAIMDISAKLAHGYVACHAYGPQSSNFLVLSEADGERFGLPVGEPLLHDLNPRCGATLIAKSWTQFVRDGKLGVGWVMSPVVVGHNGKTADVLAVLRGKKLLIEHPDEYAHGLVVYNGAVLDSGYEHKIHAVAISAGDDYNEAVAIMNQARELLK